MKAILFFLVATISSSGFAASNLMCDVSVTNGGATSLVAKGERVYLDVSEAPIAGNVITLANTKDQDGNPYEIFVRAYEKGSSTVVTLRQVCHTDWQCSEEIGSASVNGSISRAELTVSAFVSSVSSSKASVTVTCM